MMNEQKKPAVLPQETFEELSDAQLSEVSGGLEIPMLPGTGTPGSLQLGQALEKPSCFTKSDDRLSPSDVF